MSAQTNDLEINVLHRRHTWNHSGRWSNL